VIRYLSLPEVVDFHRRLIQATGGSSELRDVGLLASAIAQPRKTFGGAELYPTLVEKAAALAFSLIRNHAFVDGNKRIGHAAMEAFLMLNGHEIAAGLDEQEEVILSLAAGKIDREQFTEWVRGHVKTITESNN